MAMRLQLRRIGNSEGVILPKAMLMQAQISGEVDADIEDGNIVLSPVQRKPREGWAEAAKRCHAAGHDKILDNTDLIQNNFDQTDWKW